VLTNGTMLYEKEVRDAIMDADVVLPSLDAVSEDVFQKINRPPEGLTANKYIQGLIDFKKAFKGKIWLEVFILPGYNNSSEELEGLKRVIEQIEPESIQLNTLDRPGTVADLKGAGRAELQHIVDLWDFDNAIIISAAPKRKSILSYRSDIETAILETISRRPCTLDDLTKILGKHVNEVNKYLDVLDAENKIIAVRQERGIFYQVNE